MLHSRVNDPQAVFRAHRSGFVRRLAKQISPRTDIPEESVIERLGRDHCLAPESRRWLVDGIAPQDEKELVIAVRAIESYPKIRR